MTWQTLRGFAREMLREDRLRLRPLHSSMRAFGSIAFESVLFRDGRYQIELVQLLPSAQVNRHRHNECASLDLLLCGDGVAEIGGCAVPMVRDDAGSAFANLVPVPKGAWHGGSAGINGCTYLSFQRWDTAAKYISEDWEAWPSLAQK